MPRDIPTIEASLDRQESDAAMLVFATITHPKLTEPIRAVTSPFADNVGAHVLNGVRYEAIPFHWQMMSDDERPPRGTLGMLNYQNEIGRQVRAMGTRCRITIELYAAAEWSAVESGDPPARQPIGIPTCLYRSPQTTLVNVHGDTFIQGDLAPYGPDPTTEPASPQRATQDRFPGLFR